MTIKDTNVRVGLVMDKDFKEELEEIAKKHNRNLSNFIVTILKENIDKYK